MPDGASISFVLAVVVGLSRCWFLRKNLLRLTESGQCPTRQKNHGRNQDMNDMSPDFDVLVADIRVLLQGGSVEQARTQCTQQLMLALQDDRERARIVVELLVEAAIREALRQQRVATKPVPSR